jgi:hypothetical protein
MRWPVRIPYTVDHPREWARGADTGRDRPCTSLLTSVLTCTKTSALFPPVWCLNSALSLEDATSQEPL